MNVTSIDAIRLRAEDNVATVLRQVTAGELLDVKGPADIATALANEAIPLCHKIALEPIMAGAPVIKYGQPIGTMKADVVRGGLVHVHNMASNRGRPS